MPHSAGDLGGSCLQTEVQCYICSKNPSSHLAKDGGHGIVRDACHPGRQGEEALVHGDGLEGGGQEGGDVRVSQGRGRGRGQEQEEHGQEGHPWETGEGRPQPPLIGSCIGQREQGSAQACPPNIFSFVLLRSLNIFDDLICSSFFCYFFSSYLFSLVLKLLRKT